MLFQGWNEFLAECPDDYITGWLLEQMDFHHGKGLHEARTTGFMRSKAKKVSDYAGILKFKQSWELNWFK